LDACYGQATGICHLKDEVARSAPGAGEGENTGDARRPCSLGHKFEEPVEIREDDDYGDYRYREYHEERNGPPDTRPLLCRQG